MSDETQPTAKLLNDRALEALDGMSEAWCEKFGIAQIIRSIRVNCPTPEFQDRAHDLILRQVKQAYVEGLYTGRTSHRTPPAIRDEDRRNALIAFKDWLDVKDGRVKEFARGDANNGLWAHRKTILSILGSNE